MTEQKNTIIYYRIVIPTVLAGSLFIILIFGLILPSYENDLLESRKETLHYNLHMAENIIIGINHEYLSGKYSLNEAQDIALNTIRNMRYGPDNLEYFWITDTIPVVLMHPMKPELVGINYSQVGGEAIESIFNKSINLVKKEGEGFIHYDWQKYDDTSLTGKKISYVMGFEPWQWIIGTGMFLSDIKDDIYLLKKRLLRISFLIIFIVSIILFEMIRAALTIEKKRSNAQIEINQLNQNLEFIVEQRTKELTEAIQDMESFAYSVSHDLRSPLRHIGAYVNMMYRNIENRTETITSYYNKISAISRRMSIMIEDLLVYAKLGSKELNIRHTNMNSLVNEVIDIYRTNPVHEKIIWNIEPLPTLYIDKSLFHLAFENLISNSIKYAAKDRRLIVNIGVKEEEIFYEFYIRDNGIGFDMKYINKLFGVFEQLHTYGDYEGVGIGLAYVKLIITKHGGEIWAESRINEGATFFIRLPKHFMGKNSITNI